MFTKSDVIEAFEGTFMDRHIIPFTLEDMWYEMALGQFELEIGRIVDDDGEFLEKVGRPVINTLAYMMNAYYCERELSRVLKINNIITKDITLNGNGDTKKYATEQLAVSKARVADNVNKLKTSWYSN